MFRVLHYSMRALDSHAGDQRERASFRSVLPFRLWSCHIRFVRAGLVGAVVLCGLAQLAGAEELSPKARTAILEWLHRAGSYALDIPSEKQRDFAWTGIAAALGRMGEFDRAHKVLEQIQDEKRRREALRYVTIRIARTGEFLAATRFARSISDHNVRAEALAWTARIQAEEHYFGGARRTADLIDSLEQLSWTWYQLALSMARAGNYDAAEEMADKVVTPTKEDEQAKTDLLIFINESRDSNRKEPPLRRVTTAAEEARQILGLWSQIHEAQQDLAHATGATEQQSDPLRKAAMWLPIAWAYQQRNEIGSCRKALREVYEESRYINNPLEKALHFALSADLLLELGEKRPAQFLIEEQHLAAQGPLLSEGLTRFDTAPVIVSTLVRARNFAAVVEALTAADAKPTKSAWWALGVFGALDGKTDELKALLSRLPDDKCRVALCLGVAQGIQQQATSGSSPASPD